MAMSSGAQRAIVEATSWVTGAALFLAVLVYHNEFRTVLGLKFEPRKAAVVQAKTAPSPAREPAADLSKDADPAKAEPAAADPVAKPARSQRAGRDSWGGVRIQADTYGHYHATAYINGDPVNVLVDTGATMIALTWDDARAAGLTVRDSDFTLRSSTANGMAKFAPVTLGSVRIGDITLFDVPAAVANRGQLTKTLLGMSFLGQVRMEMRNRELVLSR